MFVKLLSVNSMGKLKDVMSEIKLAQDALRKSIAKAK